MEKTSIKNNARNGFVAGLSKANESEPQINLVASGCLMMVGAFLFILTIFHGPSMILLRGLLLAGCAIFIYASYKNFKVWCKKINDEKMNSTLNNVSLTIKDQVE